MGHPWYDRLAAAHRQPTPQKRRKALAEFRHEALLMQGRLKDPKAIATELLGGMHYAMNASFANYLLCGVLPCYGIVSDLEDWMTMAEATTALGFSLAAYKADRGAYPQRLDELVPKYVAAIPKDAFSDKGQEIIYRRTENGYVLYSIGRNGQDEGGKGPLCEPGPHDHDSLFRGDDIGLHVPAASAENEAKDAAPAD
jgi:hypothetical protein